MRENRQAIILLFIANSISGFAQGITMIAIPWFFAHILDQASTFGYIYAAATLGTLIWGTYAGVLIDRYNRKKLFIYQCLAGGGIIGSIALFGWMTGSTPMWMAAIAFITTVFIYNIHYPNLYAFAQEITPPDDYGKINSYIEIQGQVTSMIAGALAAILISETASGELHLFGTHIPLPFKLPVWDLYEVFTLDALTYLLSFLVILQIKYTVKAKRNKESGNTIQRLKVGLAWLKKHPSMFLFGLASYAIFVTILVGVYFLIPEFVSSVLNKDASVYAGAEILFALGAVFAGIAIRKIFEKTGTVNAIIIMSLLVASCYWWFNTFTEVWIFYVAMFFVGLCNAGTRIMRVTYLFKHIPNQVIGRTTSVFRVLNVICRFLFILLFSLAFFTENIHWAYYIFVVFLIGAAFVLWRLKME